MSTRSASVVIPSNGRAEALTDTLDALRRQDHPAFEVIVVVGPDAEGYDDLRADSPPEVRWLACERRNIAAARNAALDWAAGDVVACIDDDAIPDPWWLTDLDRAFDDADLAACGGPVLDVTGARYESRHRLVARSGVIHEAPTPIAGVSSPESWLVPAPPAVNCAYRRSALDAVNGFDEGFPVCLEDADLALRLTDMGWRVDQIPAGHVYHRPLANRNRDARGVPADCSHAVGALFRFAQLHGMRPGCIPRTWAEVSARLDAIRAEVDSHIARDEAPRDARERLEEAIEMAADTPAPRPAPREGTSTGQRAATLMRPFPSWGREAQRNNTDRRHLCIVLEDDRQRMAAERLARDLVTWGDVVRVIRRGPVTRVRADRGLWYHELAVPDAASNGNGVDAFWSACRDEMSRIDRMHPLDEWSSATGDDDPDGADAITRERRDGGGPARRSEDHPDRPRGALWDPSAHP